MNNQVDVPGAEDYVPGKKRVPAVVCEAPKSRVTDLVDLLKTELTEHKTELDGEHRFLHLMYDCMDKEWCWKEVSAFTFGEPVFKRSSAAVFRFLQNNEVTPKELNKAFALLGWLF